MGSSVVRYNDTTIIATLGTDKVLISYKNRIKAVHQNELKDSVQLKVVGYSKKKSCGAVVQEVANYNDILRDNKLSVEGLHMVNLLDNVSITSRDGVNINDNPLGVMLTIKGTHIYGDSAESKVSVRIDYVPSIELVLISTPGREKDTSVLFDSACFVYALARVYASYRLTQIVQSKGVLRLTACDDTIRYLETLPRKVNQGIIPYFDIKTNEFRNISWSLDSELTPLKLSISYSDLVELISNSYKSNTGCALNEVSGVYISKDRKVFMLIDGLTKSLNATVLVAYIQGDDLIAGSYFLRDGKAVDMKGHLIEKESELGRFLDKNRGFISNFTSRI